MLLYDKLQKMKNHEIWQEYCGFFDLSVEEFMQIQDRLMLEQIDLYSKCELGQRFFKGRKPESVEEFRRIVPLTNYRDYADILLSKVESALPAKPLLWIETTWEGGINPIKVAPYTESMIECLRNNCMAVVILATSNKRGHFSLTGKEKMLYGMAPLPYLTGITAHLIADELPIKFLPSLDEAEKMGFRERNKVGFKLGMQKGVDLFFGLSSVINKVAGEFGTASSSGGSLNILKTTPVMTYRLGKAWIKSKQRKTPIMPKDIWKLKGLVCSGTDSASLKKKIEHQWGVRPLEIFAGTEPTCIATETWKKNGLVLFPDACLYEFIPKIELEKNLDNPNYTPKTYLLDELLAGNEYELVISNFKGGAFVRYRTGDMLECLAMCDEEEGVQLPLFSFIDREPRFIDIAGFTRISETTISEALELSKLNVTDWFAVKEYDEHNRSFIHLYVEAGAKDVKSVVTKEIIKEHLSIYFRYIDPDFQNLKSLLGIDPLEISIMPTGTLERYYKTFGSRIRRMNPSHFDVIEILKFMRSGNKEEVS
ncbi:MAG: GH3 auxin-responsive promoter family protein [Syntrophomonadaceae bacterium]|nr:GH3 auxin-responsive promoter family protein [Syntrophomonadaceae bacterium]